MQKLEIFACGLAAFASVVIMGRACLRLYLSAEAGDLRLEHTVRLKIKATACELLFTREMMGTRIKVLQWAWRDVFSFSVYFIGRPHRFAEHIFDRRESDELKMNLEIWVWKIGRMEWPFAMYTILVSYHVLFEFSEKLSLEAGCPNLHFQTCLSHKCPPNQVWWCTPLVTAFWSQMQVDLCDFGASRGLHSEFQDR